MLIIISLITVMTKLKDNEQRGRAMNHKIGPVDLSKNENGWLVCQKD